MLFLRARYDAALTRPKLDLIQDASNRRDYPFNVTKNGHAIRLKVLGDGRTIQADMTVRNPGQHLLEALKTRMCVDLPPEHRDALLKALAPVNEAVRQLVGLTKQELHRYDLSDELIVNRSFEWSLNQQQWYPVPTEFTTSLSVVIHGNITDSTARDLQLLLCEDEVPLIATSFLHESRNARDNRYRWIYATVAAELAAKEVLTRIKPDLRVILEELPSPPLRKLYGVVLDSAAGISLPKRDLNRLNDGAEKRNKLVHTPNHVHLSDAEVDDYVNFIEHKIGWLLTQWREIRRAGILKQAQDT